MADRTTLTRFTVFAGISESALDALAGAVVERAMAEGDVLFREGDAPDDLYLVVSGRVAASRARSDGGRVEVHRLGPGDFAGLTGIFIDKPRSATLTAVEPGCYWRLPKAAVHALLETHHDLGTSLIRSLSQRYRSDAAQLTEQGMDVDHRPVAAVFDAKPYDREHFARRCPEGLRLRFLEPRLSPRTAALAAGCRVVVPFVNDTVDAPTILALRDVGVGLIAMRCAGYNNVDLDAAAAANIRVTRVPAYSPYAVAEHGFALLLTLNRKIHRAWNRVRDGDFRLGGLVGFDLHGRTIAIAGTGRIGKAMAAIARGFGMRILAWDAYPDAAWAAQAGASYAAFADCLAEADVVSLHTPLMPETHHLIDGAALGHMKPGAILINTSRGGLVDAKALIHALTEGDLGGAGLDVYEEEDEYFFEDHSGDPIRDPLLSRLVNLPNTIVTSHQAFLTADALANIADSTLGSIEAWLADEHLVNEVQP